MAQAGACPSQTSACIGLTGEDNKLGVCLVSAQEREELHL